MGKSADAFKTISEVSELLATPTHVLRFWESKFTQVKPVKRAGGRRYYRPNDVALLGGIRQLLHDDGMTIRGVQKLLRENGVRHVSDLFDPESDAVSAPTDPAPKTEVPQFEDQQVEDQHEDEATAPAASVTPFPQRPQAPPAEPAPPPEPQASLRDQGGEEAPMALDVEPEPEAEPEQQVYSLQIKTARERSREQSDALRLSRVGLRTRLASIDLARLSEIERAGLRELAQQATVLRAKLLQPAHAGADTQAASSLDHTD
ncbi:MerR family transcriptional regulator [Thioclava dalianensis]|uniref:MerR family transcriptional regulator n=1 Tax=Thioclava dalianensis TaxID=1185766 RepID=A0A074TGU8_9RHOB|nr:MerR family transcriptional regulator [Thioclava dalianensis]KEP69360.1 MerR family transcriptional regulator [Thioclava dalianensis]SFN57663.1 MerR HTH family regulatory protein [Thioclava dalianensis]